MGIGNWMFGLDESGIGGEGGMVVVVVVVVSRNNDENLLQVLRSSFQKMAITIRERAHIAVWQNGVRRGKDGNARCDALVAFDIQTIYKSPARVTRSSLLSE